MVVSYFVGVQVVNFVCLGVVVILNGDWFLGVFEMEGVVEFRYYQIMCMIGQNIVELFCMFYVSQVVFGCKCCFDCFVLFMQWFNKYNVCVNEDFVVIIILKLQKCDKDGGNGSCFMFCNDIVVNMSLIFDKDLVFNGGICDGNVGNLCDVKMGEKYEIVLDFDLGWIVLMWFYYFGIFMFFGGFGYGWIYLLGVYLVLDGVDSVGIIESIGFQCVFKKIG